MEKAVCRVCSNAFRADLVPPGTTVCVLCQQKHSREVARLKAGLVAAENAARRARLMVETETRNASLWDMEADRWGRELADFLRADPAGPYGAGDA